MKYRHSSVILLFSVRMRKCWSERSACASAYEVAIKLGIISPLSLLLSPPPPPVI